MNLSKKYFLAATFLLLSICSFSQTYTVSITGSSTATVGGSTTYTTLWKKDGVATSTPPPAGDFFWTAVKGTAGSQTSSSCTVNWTAGGAGSVTLTYITTTNQYTASRNVTVSAPAPCVSPPTFVVSNAGKSCGPASFTITATVPTGYTARWYSTSTSTTPLATGLSYTTPTVTSSGSYFVTAFNSSTSCESAKAQVALVIDPIPGVPTVSDQTIYSEKAVTLTGTVGTNGTTLRWYEGSLLKSTSTSYTTSVISQTTSFGVSSYNATTLCESAKTTLVITYYDNYNSITTFEPQVEKTSAQVLPHLTIDEIKITTAYFDGLGRPLQTVQKSGSPERKDVVQPFVYNEFGFETRKYLPVVLGVNGKYKTHSSILTGGGDYTGLADTYTGVDPLVAIDAKPFAETVLDLSPLQRSIKTGSPGVAWQPVGTASYSSTDQTIKQDYQRNIDGEVKIWTYIAPVIQSTLGLVKSTATYTQKELFVFKTKDEDNNEIIEYKDKGGKVVLKKVAVSATEFAETHYIYDDLDNLVCVIQPEGVKQIGLSADFSTNDATKEDLLSKFAFRYRYDARNRLVVKQVPGAKPVYMVYDLYDRVAMTQDGEQRKVNKWLFTKYDGLARPVITGIYAHGSSVNQEGMTQQFETSNSYATTSPKVAEQYTGVATTHGYSNNTFPSVSIAGTEVLTASYYDLYSFKTLINNTAFNYQNNQLTGQEASEFKRARGQLTGTKIKVLNTASTFLYSVTYYDPKYRPIQTVAHNYANGIDIVTMRYDFVKLLETKTSHTRGANTYVVKRRTDYDHVARPLKLYHLVGTNSSDEVSLSENVYNKIGQLVTKKLHSRNGEAAKQNIDLRYNIRGWLQGINETGTIEPSDLFRMTLNYNTPTTKGGAAQFNGNISEMLWTTVGLDRQSYGYTYDKLSRLTEAKYYDHDSPYKDNRYNESIGTTGVSGYDLNGNIKKLTRNGKQDGTMRNFGLMDDLTYTYLGNRLTKVEDNVITNTQEEGFKEIENASDDYYYDENGSMSKDVNKAINSITYNHLNLPVRVEKSATEYIVYTYDATGKKLSQQVFGSTPKTTDYLGEFIYENGALTLINHEEGRILPDNTAGAPRPWEYQYHLKDHLGNVRVTFSEKKTSTCYTATLEDSTRPQEEATFKGYGNRSPFNLFDHTDAGTTNTYSQLLKGGSNSQVGLAKSFSVNSGDVLDIEVYAKYEAPSGPGNSPNALVNSLISAFGISASGTGPLDGQQALNAFNSNYTAGPLVGRTAYPYEDGTAPRAYVNYILFDENFALLDFGYDQVDYDARQVDAVPVVAHDYLSLHVKVKKKGYLYVYLSNEQPVETNVYFDDLKISHHTAIDQIQDYYPFGLTFNSYQRENSIANKFKFQGQEHVDDLNLGWVSFKWRNHDPTIGRFFNVDPLSDKYVHNSVYAFSENKVTNHIELEGLEAVERKVLDDPAKAANRGGMKPVQAALQSNVSSNLKAASNSASNIVSGNVGVQAAGIGVKVKVAGALHVEASGKVLSGEAGYSNKDGATASVSVAETSFGLKVANVGAEATSTNMTFDGQEFKIIDQSASANLGPVQYGSSENEFSVGGTLGYLSAEVSANLDAVGDAIDSTVEAVKSYFQNLLPPIWEE
jgi:RHS repeat-associated protein